MEWLYCLEAFTQHLLEVILCEMKKAYRRMVYINFYAISQMEFILSNRHMLFVVGNGDRSANALVGPVA